MVLQHLMRCKGKMTFISSHGCHYILSYVPFPQNFTLTEPLPDPLATTTVEVRVHVNNSLHLLWVYMCIYLKYQEKLQTRGWGDKRPVCKLFVLACSSLLESTQILLNKLNINTHTHTHFLEPLSFFLSLILTLCGYYVLAIFFLIGNHPADVFLLFKSSPWMATLAKHISNSIPLISINVVIIIPFLGSSGLLQYLHFGQSCLSRNKEWGKTCFHWLEFMAE